MNKELLSDNFIRWYEDILKILAGEKIAVHDLVVHPHFYITCSYSNSREAVLKCIYDQTRSSSSHASIVAASGRMSKWLAHFKNASFIKHLELMPPITSADMLQNPRKVCRLLTTDLKMWFVAIEVDNLRNYHRALLKLQEITNRFNKRKVKGLTVSIIGEWALIREDGREFFVSKFLGQTLEQRLKRGNISPADKANVVRTLNEFALFSQNLGIYWRDFAPRNMFVSKRGLALIDFENLQETVTMTSADRAYWDRFRRIWYADVLTKGEIDQVYQGLPGSSVRDNGTIAADLIEKDYFHENSITIKQHLDFLDLTASFEKSQQIGSRVVYGHGMGLYLSDFHGHQDESRVYSAMENLSPKDWAQLLLKLQEAIDKEQRDWLLSMYVVNTERPNEVDRVLGAVERRYV